MIVNPKSAVLLPACLAAGGLVLSAALFGALSITPTASREAAGDVSVRDVVPAGEEPIEPGFSMPPAKSFVEIVTRPIFASNRRPTLEQEISIETISSELEIRLIGVIVASGEPIAIVAPRVGDAFARLTVGDRYQGWTVAQIEPHGVTFRRNEAIERLELGYDLPPTRPRKATARTGDKKAEKKEQD